MKKRIWGEDPYFFGPRNYFRQTLLMSYIRTKARTMDKCKSTNSYTKLLDAGCGNGSMSIRLAKKGYQVVGIDITDENINFANYVKRKMDIDNVNFIKMSVDNIYFPKNAFDIVACGEVLEHVKDDDKAVKCFNKVLKLGGECVITVPCNPKLWSLEDEWVGHVRRYRAKELRELLLRNGFRINKMRYFGFPLIRLYFMIFKSAVLENKVTSNKMSSKSKILQSVYKALSYIFFFDNMFDWCRHGTGLIVRAVKVKEI